MPVECPATVERDRAQLLSFIEQGLLIADRLDERDAGIWLDRARVSLSKSLIERACLFAD